MFKLNFCVTGLSKIIASFLIFVYFQHHCLCCFIDLKYIIRIDPTPKIPMFLRGTLIILHQ